MDGSRHKNYLDGAPQRAPRKDPPIILPGRGSKVRQRLVGLRGSMGHPEDKMDDIGPGAFVARNKRHISNKGALPRLLANLQPFLRMVLSRS